MEFVMTALQEEDDFQSKYRETREQQPLAKGRQPHLIEVGTAGLAWLRSRLIGPSGANMKAIREQTGVTFDLVDADDQQNLVAFVQVQSRTRSEAIPDRVWIRNRAGVKGRGLMVWDGARHQFNGKYKKT